MIFSYPLPFCYSGYDQLVMELITSQVKEAAGSRLSRVSREILSAPPARGSQAAEGSHPPPGSGRRWRRPGRTMGRRPAGELDLSSALGGPASSLEALPPLLERRGRMAGARAQLWRTSPGPGGGGARPARSRPLDFEIRTADGEDTF
jgi:hypothetical protein